MATEREEALHGYVTDMLALEEHIGEAIAAQRSNFEKEFPDTCGELHKMHAKIGQHVTALKAIADRHEGAATQKVGDAVKRAASMLAGLGAAAIDLVRTERLPKNLRDDFTAFSLASIGYLMLNTTALAFENKDVAKLAEEHLGDYAEMLRTLQRLIPVAVLDELQGSQLAPRTDVLDAVHKNLHAAWSAA